MRTAYPAFIRFIFAALASLITCTAQSATVSWTGGGGDNLWHNDANWSGGAIPGQDDDVIINVAANPVITVASLSANVRSVQCAESLQLNAVALTLTSGTSSFTGPLNLSGGSVSVHGVDTVANVSGVTTVSGGASCYVYNGAELWLTNLPKLVLTNGNMTVWAQGADASIYLSNVTNVVASPSYVLYVYAYDGGLVDLHRLRNPDGGLQVSSSSAGSIVDLSGLSGALAAPEGFVHSFYADGGAIPMPQVTALKRVSIGVTGEGTVGFGSVTNAEESSFYAYNGGKLWLTNLTTLVLTNGNMTVSAQGVEAAIYLSNVTNIVASPGYVLYVYAFDGGLVDLHRLRNPDGGLQVQSASGGSVVDLSGLSGALTAPEGLTHDFYAAGGAILIPQVTALKRVTVSVMGEGQVGFGSVTNAEESSFYAYNGGKLWLTNLTTLVLTNNNISVWAQGVDAVIYLSNVTNVVANPGYVFYVYAFDGGLVDLHRLRNPNSGLQISSSSVGSVVDLSGLSGALAAPEGFSHSFTANEGTILMPLVTALTRVVISVTGEGMVRLGSVTNAEESSFFAYTGARLWLTNLTTLVLTNGSMTVWAQGADAAIYLSNVTNFVTGPGYLLYVYAFEGGLVDLHRLRNPDGGLQVLSSSVGSIVDLSGLSGSLAAPVGFLHSFNADDGSILMSQVTTLTRATVSVTGEGQVGLGSLRNAEESSFYAYSGARLWLTNLTGLVLTNGNMTVWVQGADTAIYLSNVTNVVAGPGYGLLVYTFEGGLVDLHRLRNLNSGLQVQSGSGGSVVDLSGLTGPLAAPEGFSHSFSANDGTILMPQVTALTRASVSVTGEGMVDFGLLTHATDASFYAYNGGKLWLTNLTTITASNTIVFLWAQGADAALHLPAATNVVNNLGVYVYAWEGGNVDLGGLSSFSTGNFLVWSRGAGSVIDLSGVSGLTPQAGGSTLKTESGGVILFNDMAILIANVALDLESNPDLLAPFMDAGTSMVLYGRSWRAYRIEARDTRVPGASWDLYRRVALTNTFQAVAPRPPLNLEFRVLEIQPDPPELAIDITGPQQIQVILFGVPGQTYRLESKPAFDGAASWQNAPNVTLTNAFRIFPASSSADLSRFYRARKL